MHQNVVQADLIFRLSAIHSFAFGALISAVDPVATLAIFQVRICET
jgi:NhaP-type Na+/H+ or K+/H+ antiporter